VTPHIGQRAKFRYIPESDRTARVASAPGYTNDRVSEARAVIERMAQLNDYSKIQMEKFDDKPQVAGVALVAFANKVLTDGYQDNELEQPGLILSFDRFIHFVQTLTAADYDAVVIAWKEKMNFDMIRPTSIIKEMSGDITTWAMGGIQTFPASDFEAYMRVMPHSEYVSASACIFEAQKDMVNAYLTGIGLSTSSFPVVFPTVRAGGSRIEPGVVPATDLTLFYPNMETMATAGGNSRLDGGMHFDASVPAAQALCSGIGNDAVTGSFALY
jgi:hypothetical protein